MLGLGRNAPCGPAPHGRAGTAKTADLADAGAITAVKDEAVSQPGTDLNQQEALAATPCDPIDCSGHGECLDGVLLTASSPGQGPGCRRQGAV